MRKQTSTEQSYEPLVTPESWKGDELRFSVRLTQILDGLFARLRAMRTELAGKLGRTEQAADSAKLGGADADSFALKTDTAPNAEKLGGKPPEYYTWSNNLLYNSNFESPYLVNHLGYASGSAVSPWGEFINCWVNANDAEKAFTLSSDGISMPANTTIWQIANRVSDGDTVTIAVCDGNGDVYAASGTVRFNSDKSWYRCITGNGNNFDLYADTYNGDFEFIIWAANDVKIKWAVLYKGAYTADTLPQPQWLHPRLEMIRMGLETQPVNLLDNSDFANPVNQRGQTTYSGSGTYAIDRWYVGGPNQRIDIVSGGIKGVTTKGSAFATIAQNVANVTRYAGKTLTFAAYVRSNVVPRLNIYNGGTSFSTKEGTSGDYNLIVCSFVVPDNITDGALSVRIQSKSTQEDDYVEAKWAALYEGTYTAETLPPYVPEKNELTACQNRCVKIKCKNKPLGFGHAYTNDTFRFLIPTPVSMADDVVPSLGFELSDGTPSNAVSTLLIASGGTLFTPTAVSVDGTARENGIILLCTVSGATKYQPASLYCSGNMLISTDL